MKNIFKQILKILPITIALVLLLFFVGCSKKISLNKYVSERRTEIFYCEQDGYVLTAFHTQKEYPYTADGIVGDLSDVFDVTLKAPDNSLDYNIYFTLDDKEISGEMSFESVRQIYTFSLSLPVPTQKQIEFKITSTETETTMLAKSVKGDKTLTSDAIIQIIQKSEKQIISSLTQNGKLVAEIYLRLIYKDRELFYFVAIFDREGNSYSLLVNSESGEILARKEN